MDVRRSRFLLDHLEMLLNGLFLLVMILVHILASRLSPDPWEVTAWVAIGLATFDLLLVYWVRRHQQLLRQKYLEQAQNLIYEEVKVDTRLLVDQFAEREEQAWRELESIRRIAQIADFVGDVHSFIMSNCLFERLTIPRITR